MGRGAMKAAAEPARARRRTMLISKERASSATSQSRVRGRWGKVGEVRGTVSASTTCGSGMDVEKAWFYQFFPTHFIAHAHTTPDCYTYARATKACFKGVLLEHDRCGETGEKLSDSSKSRPLRPNTT